MRRPPVLLEAEGALEEDAAGTPLADALRLAERPCSGGAGWVSPPPLLSRRPLLNTPAPCGASSREAYLDVPAQPLLLLLLADHAQLLAQFRDDDPPPAPPCSPHQGGLRPFDTNARRLEASPGMAGVERGGAAPGSFPRMESRLGALGVYDRQLWLLWQQANKVAEKRAEAKKGKQDLDGAR